MQNYLASMVLWTHSLSESNCKPACNYIEKFNIFLTIKSLTGVLVSSKALRARAYAKALAFPLANFSNYANYWDIFH